MDYLNLTKVERMEKVLLNLLVFIVIYIVLDAISAAGVASSIAFILHLVQCVLMLIALATQRVGLGW